MATLTSAAAILKSAEFFEANEDAKKYLRHQFQDLGYRLAEQLGDLGHRNIYMKLAKSEDKAVIDQALSFALDYRDVTNKGRLFMWKLREVRKERDIRRAMTNFAEEFVMQTMSKTYDKLCRQIMAKQKQRLDSRREEQLGLLALRANSLPQGSRRTAAKVLNLGCGGGVDLKYLSQCAVRPYGLDISNKVVGLAKKFCTVQSATKAPKISIVRKQSFLQNSYKETQFQAAWLDRFWQVIPLEQESAYLVELHRILQSGAPIYFSLRTGPEASQNWQIIDWQEEKLLSLFKVNLSTAVLETLDKVGFEVEKVEETAPHGQGIWAIRR